MYDMFIMNMGGNDANVHALVQRFPHARVVRYYGTHLNTLKRCISRCRTSKAWLISSCCDYSQFDFDYQPAPWESYQIHCWASGNQQYGDTFLVPVKEFINQQDVELLEWYRDINYHADGVPRFAWPLIRTIDNIPATLKEYTFTTPYVAINKQADYDVQLWKDREFCAITPSGRVSLAPREISAHLQHQIYDYPHIKKLKSSIPAEKPLDIIYISNGEPNANKWYDHLRNVVGNTTICKHSANVTGRVKAYKAAAELSDSPWFFAVFAKLEVNPLFDWNWQPDYLQEPKHYIFNSRNPLNGLEYGHQGIIAYNKQLVLDTDEHGLDFTLSKPHAVIPLLSGTAHYNTSEELTWRTAFREVIKLQHDVNLTSSVESEYRLQQWLTVANGEYAEWSIKGAEDAVSYYCSVNGDYDKLLLSFEWNWLSNYYATKYMS